MKSRHLLVVAIFSAVLLSLFAGVAAYWLLESESPLVTLLEWNTHDSQLAVKRQFKRGETIYSWRKIYSPRYASHLKVWRILIADEHNTTVMEYEVKPIPSGPGISERTVVIGRLPLDAPLGMYHVRTFGVYVLNPLRDATYELLPSITFEVVK